MEEMSRDDTVSTVQVKVTTSTASNALGDATRSALSQYSLMRATSRYYTHAALFLEKE